MTEWRRTRPGERPGRCVAVGAVVLGLLPLLLASPAWAYEREIRSAAAQMAEGMAKTGKRSVAVVDFTDLQGNVTELGRFLAEQLSVATALEGGTFEVIDRTHLKALLQEHKLSASGLIDPQTARKLGQLAGVEALATGSITPFGDSVNLSIKLLDTNTGRLLAASSVEIPRTKAIEELLARGIGPAQSGARQDAQSPVTTSNRQQATSADGEKVRAAAPITERSGDLEATVLQCSQSGGSVSCEGVIRNTGSTRQRMGFDVVSYGSDRRPGSRYCEAVDDTGGQSSSCAVALGSGPAVQELEPDTPIRFRVSRVEVSPEASFVTLSFKVRHTANRGSFSVGSSAGTISFRRVQLVRK